MIRSILANLLLLLSLGVNAGEIQIPGTSISFMAPEGFSALTEEEIDIKFPSKTGPRQAIGNDRRTTTVAYGVRDVAVTAEILERQIDAINDTFEGAIPGFVSLDRGMHSLNGHPWAYFEMTSKAIDTDIHNIVLMTSHAGRMVVLNFNSTKTDFKTMESHLRSSISSLRVRE